MGLDTVELVMAIEEEFAIEVPNIVAEKLVLIGDMHRFVLQTLRARGETPDESAVWERLKAVVVKQLGVRPDQVTPTTHIIEDLKVD